MPFLALPDARLLAPVVKRCDHCAEPLTQFAFIIEKGRKLCKACTVEAQAEIRLLDELLGEPEPLDTAR